MKNSTLPLLALLAGASSASAASLLNADFDSTNPGYVYAYSYQATGSSSNNNGQPSPVAGVGVGGTAGTVATFNTTLMGGNSAGFGHGFGGTPTNASAIAGATSLADFSFSLAALATGMTGTSAPVRYEIKFEAPDGTLGATNGQTDVLLTLSFFASLTTAYSTTSNTLAAWIIDNGTLAQVQANLGALSNINVNISYDGALVPAFGLDSDNTISADNLSFSVADPIPEPSSLLLGALGVLGFAARRRRSA